MRELRFEPSFEAWRQAARDALRRGWGPPQILWKPDGEAQAELGGLFADPPLDRDPAPHPGSAPVGGDFPVPADFVARAKYVAAHADSARWPLLYRVLWRLTHGEPELLRVAVDPDTAQFDSMYRSVRRDLHKMHAFVRFREVRDQEFADHPSRGPRFVAWYRPDHPILRLAAPFFARRFNGMRWTILTEHESVSWDGGKLEFSPGCPRSLAPKQDDVEALWKTYYASIFNPARIKTGAMRKEMPVRYWKTLPESEIIHALIREAPKRMGEFYAQETERPPGAEHWLPKRTPADGPVTLADLKQAAAGCRACGICEHATQTVFGEGPAEARVVLVGEQPGDREDLEGRMFVGPAGQLLDQALGEAGLVRSELYLTNAVKHFKWKPQGKVRLHQRPSSAEIAACNPWLRAELQLLQPQVLVCLGVSAAQAVLGKAVTLNESRGRFLESARCERTLVTTHPSAILRAATPEQQREDYARFVSELRLVRDLLSFGVSHRNP